SSPLTAKASTVCASLLDHITSTTSLLCLFSLLFVIDTRSLGHILVYALSLAPIDASISKKMLAKTFLLISINLLKKVLGSVTRQGQY
ncbi:hypothetical protein, partial [Legionella nautarum]|uniref:hypothetical protein n=1 Tax=Legionella nautarum TaxID=45070 RepID=UPI001EE6E7D4